MSYVFDSNQLLSKFTETRDHSLFICQPLKTEDFVVQTFENVSPPKWHLGHTSWFFEVFILQQFSSNYKLFNQHFPYIFNSYYNHMGHRVERDKRGLLTRPILKEVLAYRTYVNEAMIELFKNDVPPEASKLIEIGIHHEQQHQELLVYDCKHILASQVIPSSFGHKTYEIEPETGKTEWHTIDEGLYEIGHDATAFGYDNEKPRHKVYLQKAALASRLTTNKEFLEFVEDGAYQNHQLWHAEAWDYINQHQIYAPFYWRKQKGKWSEYKLSGESDLKLDCPVMHVSYYEAAAFADWAGYQLPTEAHWEICADWLNWGQLWEWTASAYLPYPKYKKPNGALGEYNAKFMLNQKVLRGASVATSKQHSRKTYRNFFHTHERWMFSGIRLMKIF